MISRLLRFLRYKNRCLNYLPDIKNHLANDLKNVKNNIGQLQAQLNNAKTSIASLSEVEFQVYSQWGDDGIIQYLVNKVDIPNKTFIEFGVENYTESNTRFLLISNNWSGYVIDGSEKNIDYIKRDNISWACELYAECAFITKENINQLLLIPGFAREVGILSIDIDGNDYWVWQEINSINPVIVIAEYNSLWGYNTQWTVPYDPEFVRHRKHWSQLYYGASLNALVELGKKKGYDFIGCNSKGNNAYFVRSDKQYPVSKKTAKEGYVLSRFREAEKDGQKISGTNRIKAIEGMEVVDLETQSTTVIRPELVRY